MSPLLLSLDESVLRGYLEGCPELSDYAFMIEDLLRSKQHVLSASEEKLLSLAGDFPAAPRIFSRCWTTRT